MLSHLFWVALVAAAVAQPDGDVPPDSKAGEDGPSGSKSGSADGPSMDMSGSKSADASGSGSKSAEPSGSKSGSEDGPSGSKSGSADGPSGGDSPLHGWMPPTGPGMSSCDELLDAAMGGTVENPDFSLDGGLFDGIIGGDETTEEPETTDERDGVLRPECLHAGMMDGEVSGSSMCNGVDFMGIHTVATEACMAESVDGVAASSMIKCVDGTGFIYEWDNEDCSGDGDVTEASEYGVTVNCDAFAGDCEYLTIRRGESGDDDTCSYENYYDSAIAMGDCYDIGGLGVAFISMECEDGSLVVMEYTEDGCTGEPTDVTTQYLENPNSPAGSKSGSGSGSKSASEDGPSGSKSGSEDGPSGSKSGSEDGPSMDMSGSKSADASGSGSKSAEPSGSKSGSEDGPSGSKSGSADGPSMDMSGSGSKSADASGSKEAASGEIPDWASGDAPDSKEAFGCDDDDTDCFTPEPKGFDVTDEDGDWITPEPKSGSKSGSEDGPSGSKSGSEDGPSGSKSGSEDGPSGSKSGSEDAPSGSKSGSEDGPSGSKSGSEEGPSGSKSGSEDGPSMDMSGSKSADGSGSGSKSASGDAPDSKEGGIETDCIEIVYCSTTEWTNENIGEDDDGSAFNSGAAQLVASAWMVVAAYFAM